jgi:2-keto-4-pentenoate hydratase/2-oxohepta-3-ene-1,7-dioic acid hydratase in catechol pathway
MKLLTYRNGGDPRIGLHLEGQVVDLARAYRRLTDGGRLPSTMLGLLDLGDAGLDRARVVEEASRRDRTRLCETPGIVHDVAEVQLMAPIPRPRKNVICLGLNYADHAEETRQPLPTHPVFFTKAPTSIIGPETPIRLPRCSREVDYEVELAFVFGAQGKDLEDDVDDAIVGYTVMNDVTARDLQRNHRQWFRGKSLDTFAPMGPYLVTKDEIPEPYRLNVGTRLNDVSMQESNTANLIFDIPTLVRHITADMTVEPGDIVSTGTPSGVGFTRTPPVFLRDGDVVEVWVEDVGTLRNSVSGS